MTLASGTKLGPYEIVGAVGAGGMGEVYQARDSRLERSQLATPRERQIVV
jgi:serine/threonine protein kinase